MLIYIDRDNTTTVDFFNFLHCRPEYNAVLRFSVALLLEGEHDLRVLHNPGEENEIAQASKGSVLDNPTSFKNSFEVALETAIGGLGIQNRSFFSLASPSLLRVQVKGFQVNIINWLTKFTFSWKHCIQCIIHMT